MGGLDFGAAVHDIVSAAKALKENGYTSVGITGFCMGGALTLAACSHSTEFKAAAPFYGVPDLSKAPVGNIKCPVLAHFGENDDAKGFSDPDTAHKLEKTCKDAGVEFTLHMWKGAGHAFMNQANPKTY